MDDIEEGLYKHFKGNTYYIDGVGRHSETLERMVVYWPVNDVNDIWIRPVKEFLRPLPDGSPRFQRLA